MAERPKDRPPRQHGTHPGQPGAVRRGRQGRTRRERPEVPRTGPVNNTYALAIRDQATEEVGVETLSDLATLVEENPEEATVCVESEFNFAFLLTLLDSIILSAPVDLSPLVTARDV